MLTQLTPDSDTDSTIPCPQCDRLFYRRDLLHRHITLKHGKSPRASAKASADRGTHLETTTLTTDTPINGVTFAVNEVDVGIENVALPVLEHLFPFPSPPLDLADDWGWSHQNPAVLPVNSDPVAQIDGNEDMAELVGALEHLPHDTN